MLRAPRPRLVNEQLQSAARSLAAGEPVLIFDAADREGETDLVILSERATPELVRLLRQDAGGWICTAISDELRQRLGLPFYSDLLVRAAPEYPILSELGKEELRYDRRSPFGIHVHHRATYTGIPDNDRATAIRAIGVLARDAPRLSEGEIRARFASEFSSPGHLPIIYAAPGLLSERKGHTELSVSLARMTGLSESMTVCEMLGDSGGARSPDAARDYAGAHGWQFLEGRTLIEAWREWSSE
ncbi:MAG TPA: 3,4-dihydroxy-2-butanone-4-phosphate synthase [Thermoplasmata archaeon]|nr:3,4-dihydroxy-2-butanone-4-phosphate synthase [Thermoplasmata archaeon]